MAIISHEAQALPAPARAPDHDDLVHAIYECALHPDGWDRTLTRIRQYLNASAINLIGLEVAAFDNPFLYTANIPADYGKLYQSHWSQVDPWVLSARAKRLGQGGYTLAGGMLVDSGELRRSEFFNDWLAGQDIKDVLCTNLWGREAHWGQDPDYPRIVLCFMRGLKAESFGKADWRKLHALSAHLNQAFRIALRLGLLQRGGALQEAAIDGLTQAVFILDGQRRILSANAAGQRLLAGDDDLLRVRHHRVTALGHRSAPGLDEAFALAGRGRPVPIAFTHGPEFLRPRAGSARLVPLNEVMARGLQAEQAAYVFILDARQSIDTDALQAFCGLYGITRAEQAVLRKLLEDATPEEIAAGLGLAQSTVRTYLRNLRQKTGARRLSALVRTATLALPR